MKNLFIVLFLSFLASYLTTSCDKLENWNDTIIEESSVDENLSFEEDFEWLTTTDGFGLMLPKYFDLDVIDTNYFYSYDKTNLTKSLLAYGLAIPKKELIKFKEEVKNYNDTLSISKNFIEQSLINLQDTFGLDKVVKRQSTKLRGLDLEILEIVTSKNKSQGLHSKIGATLAFLESEENFYALYYICNGLKYEQYRISFEKSLSTFRELPIQRKK